MGVSSTFCFWECRSGTMSCVDRLVNGAAVAHDIVMRNHELLERRVDVVEIDVGDEAVDAGVDAAWSVADGVTAVDDVGKLAARRFRGVEYMLVGERHARKLEEGKDLEAVAVIVGNAEQRGVGVQREHGGVPLEAAAMIG